MKQEKRYVKYAVTSARGWGWGDTPFEAFFKNPYTLDYSHSNVMKQIDHHFRLFEIHCHEPEVGDNWQIWFQHDDGWVSSHRDDVVCTYVCEDIFKPNQFFRDSKSKKNQISEYYMEKRNRLSGGNRPASPYQKAPTNTVEV